jgi:hypothetical protein
MNHVDARSRFHDQMAMPSMLGNAFDWRYRKSFCLEDLKVMDGLERLSVSSRRLRRIFMFLMVVSPVLTALFWVVVGMGNEVVAHNLPVKIDPEVPTYVLVLCFWVSMIPTGVVMYAFYQLIKLLGFYGKGTMFASENVITIRTLGKTIIAWEIANFLCSTVLGLLLTLHRGPGQRLLVVGVDNADIYALVAGFSVLTVAWVMDEARKIKEEQELIV